MKRTLWGDPGRLGIIAFLIFFGYTGINAQSKLCDNKKADKLLQQGEAEYTRRNFQQAITLYDQAAKSAPTCAVPYLYKGEGLHYLQRFDESILALQEAIKRSVADPWRPNAMICDDYFSLKKYKEAISSCGEAVRLNNTLEPSYALMAQSYFNLANYEAALTALKSAVDLKPDNFDTRLLKGKILYSLERKKESIPDFLEATKISPDNFEAFSMLGQVYYETKDYSKTAETLSRAVKLNRDDSYSWVLLSIAYSNLSEWAKAEEAAKESVRLKPDDGNMNYALGSVQLFTGDLEGAIKSFDAAIKYKNILMVSAAVYKGYAYIGLRQKDKAEEAFQEALTLKPAAGIDYILLSQVYSYRWELDKAREQIQKSIRFASDDDDSIGFAMLSWNRILAGDPQEAINAANEAIQRDPKGSLGYTQRCRANNELNLTEVAVKDCQTSLEKDPEDGETLFYLGRSFALKKDPIQEKYYNRKAIQSLEKLLGIPTGPPVEGKPVNLILAAKSLPADKKRITLSSPLYIELLYLLGNAYFFDDNSPAAINVYENAAELRPKFPRLRFNLAVCYLRLKRPDIKNATLQYQALLPLDKKLAADLKKNIDGFKRTK